MHFNTLMQVNIKYVGKRHCFFPSGNCFSEDHQTITEHDEADISTLILLCRLWLFLFLFFSSGSKASSEDVNAEFTRYSHLTMMATPREVKGQMYCNNLKMSVQR